MGRAGGRARGRTVASVHRHRVASPVDLSALRHALWPLVRDPEPPEVLEALVGLMYADLTSGRRELTDTVTVLRQMRSMLRLPRAVYADVNRALVAHDAETEPRAAIAAWLRDYKRVVVARAITPADASDWVRMRIAPWPRDLVGHEAAINRFFAGQRREPAEVLLAAEAWTRAQGCVEFASDARIDNVTSRAGPLASTRSAGS